MPLKNYGVLKGRAVQTLNSPNANNHYQVRIVDDNEKHYRIAINVRSKLNPPNLLYYINADFQHPIISAVEGLSTGFTKKTNGNALGVDYIRSNLFPITAMKVISDVAPGENNDLNDIFDFYIKRAMEQKAFIYAFGDCWIEPQKADKYFPFRPSCGIHDIHMNQGNSGEFRIDNGVYQDGALLIELRDSWVAIFLRFQSQAIHTDDQTGDALPYDRVLLPEFAEGLRIIAALVNPSEGKEIQVLIFNPLPTSLSLEGWSIVDVYDQALPLSGRINSGECLKISCKKPLSFPRKRGILTIVNAKGLKVHGVSYTSSDYDLKGNWVIF